MRRCRFSSPQPRGDSSGEQERREREREEAKLSAPFWAGWFRFWGMRFRWGWRRRAGGLASGVTRVDTAADAWCERACAAPRSRGGEPSGMRWARQPRLELRRSSDRVVDARRDRWMPNTQQAGQQADPSVDCRGSEDLLLPSWHFTLIFIIGKATLGRPPLFPQILFFGLRGTHSIPNCLSF